MAEGKRPATLEDDYLARVRRPNRSEAADTRSDAADGARSWNQAQLGSGRTLQYRTSPCSRCDPWTPNRWCRLADETGLHPAGDSDRCRTLMYVPIRVSDGIGCDGGGATRDH